MDALPPRGLSAKLAGPGPGGSQPSTAAAPGLALGLSAVVNSKGSGSGSGSPSWSARFLPPPGEPAAGPSLLPVSRPQEINALDLIKAKKKKKSPVGGGWTPLTECLELSCGQYSINKRQSRV